jgi:hypothetical protein
MTLNRVLILESNKLPNNYLSENYEELRIMLVIRQLFMHFSETVHLYFSNKAFATNSHQHDLIMLSGNKFY